MSKEFAVLVAKPCGNGKRKKSSGSDPFDDVRKLFIIVRIAASCAAPAVVEASGFPLAVAHALYSVVVIGTCALMPLIVSAENSVGKFPPLPVKPAVPDELASRKSGWLKALIKSTLKLIRRFPSLSLNGKRKSFWSEKSKYCCNGPRIFSVRGASPRLPFAGRINAAGLMYGSQGVTPSDEMPNGQSGLNKGFFNGTPGTRSGRTVRVFPPSRFESVRYGTNGVPPCRRKTPVTAQPPITASTAPGALLRKDRLRPTGRSQMKVELKLC